MEHERVVVSLSCSISLRAASATRLRMRALTATAERPHWSATAWAASMARSTSSACERAIRQMTWPVVGEILSK
jgi:hypothetical protein